MQEVRAVESVMEVETQVLVVGAGPVGLAMAADLGWRGVPCLLADRRDGRIGLPRMNAVNARTMEFCRRWGIAQRVRDAGWPRDFPRRQMYMSSLTGYEFERFDFGPMVPLEVSNSPEHFQRCSQMWFDPLLRDFALEFPTNDLRYGWSLEGFVDEGDCVVAELVSSKGEGRLVVRADYLVGCDGSRSSVREALGIGVDGWSQLSQEVSIYFYSDAPMTLPGTTPATMTWFIGPKGMWGIVTAIDGRTYWRLWVSQLPDGVDPAKVDAEAYVRAAIGCDVPFEVVGMVPWARQEVVAQQYRRGRVFLAGDAVHTFTPTGGFGMNTGIQDAVDLAWKLAGVLEGWADEGILDSYEAERRPVGIRNTREATFTFTMLANIPEYPHLLDESPEGEKARDGLREYLRSRDFVREYRNEGIVLGYRYDNSPICVTDGTPAPIDDVMVYEPTTRPGARAPHVWLEPDRSTLDLFGRGFTLLVLGADAVSPVGLVQAAKGRGVPLTVVTLSDPQVVERYERRLVLVRPDGHVAWRGDRAPTDPFGVIDVITGKSAQESSRVAAVEVSV